MMTLSLGEIKITRRFLSRLCAQSYDRLGIFMSCITTGLKILTSRSCELASITEMDIDLEEKDADFVKVVGNFLKNLKLVHTILPLHQWICGRGEEIIGIGSTCDGGVPAFGCVNYLICRNTSTKEKISKICCSKSKISKRSVPANEALARMLQADTYKVYCKSNFKKS